MQSIAFKDLPQSENDKSGWPWTQETVKPTESLPAGFKYPRISVVTPSYNQGSFIEETLRSVLLQEYPNLEYMIIDGGSSDKSVEVIKKYEHFLTYWISETDRGQSHAINKGLAKSTGSILAYLNSDDLYLPGTLRTVSRYFSCHPDIDILYGDCRMIDEKSLFIERWSSRPFSLLRELCKNFIYQPTIFIRRRVLDRIGHFDETLNYTMDIDYWYRAGNYFKFGYLPEELACFRVTPESKTGSSRIKPIEERKNLIHNYLRNCKNPYIKKNHRRILSWHHYHAGEQLYSNAEFRPAIREFLNGIQFDPISTKTLFSIFAMVDAWIGTNFFPPLNRRFVSPSDY